MDFQTQFLNFIDDTVRSVPEHFLVCQEIITNIKDKNMINIYKTHFLKHTQEHNEKIANQDETLFTELDLDFIKGIHLKQYWSQFSTDTISTIWKYIQILILCSTLSNINNKDVSLNTQNTDISGNNEVLSDILNQGFDENIIKKMMENLKTDSGEIKGQDDIMKTLTESKIGSLAKDIMETIGNDKLVESMGLDKLDPNDIKNPSDLLGKLTNNGGMKNVMGMMNKVGNILQEKMSNGELNAQDLVQDAISMMGSLGKKMNNPMMKNLQSMLEQQTRKTAYSQKLKKKLEERQKNQNITETTQEQNEKKKTKRGKRGGKRLKK